MSTSDDSALVRDTLSGNGDGFREIVARYFSTVRLVALAKTGNFADADDVAQETFIRAYETLGVLRDHSRLAHWLVSIARNIAISQVRKRERDQARVDALPRDLVIHPNHERRETLEAVARQVEGLPENLREVVLLYYFEGLKCREIAERLDLNTNAVVKRLGRAREVLGDRLLREWGETDRAEAGARIQGVMAAIIALPRPDWKGQLAGAKSGGWAAVVSLLAAYPIVTKLTCATLLVAGAVAVRAALEPSESAAAPQTNNATQEVASAESGVMGKLLASLANQWQNLAEREWDGPIAIPIEPIAPTPMAEIGFVSGVVVDIDGAPVRDADLWAGVSKWAGDGQNSGRGVSNANGEFRINVFAPESEIDAGKVSKYVSVTCSRPGFVSPAPLDVSLGTSDLKVVLARPAVLTGKVVDARTGGPVTNFSVRSDLESLVNPETGISTHPQWQSTSSATGEFRLEGAYGIQQLEVIARGYLGVRADVGLAQGEHGEGIVVALEPGGVIHGFVLDAETREPISKATVRFAEPQDEPRADYEYSAKTKNDGSFEWTDLPLDGPLSLVAGSQGYRLEPFSVVATKGTEPEPVTVYLERGGLIRGRVYKNDGPPPGCDETDIKEGYCMVVARVPGGDWAGSGFARPDGSYGISGLEDGEYLVSASYRVDRIGAHGESISRRVNVSDGAVAELDIDFDDPVGNIALKVSGLEALEAVQFELHAVGDPHMLKSFSLSAPRPFRGLLRPGVPVDSDTASEYRFPIKVGDLPVLAPGDYVLRCYPPGKEDIAIEEGIQVLGGETSELTIDVSAFADTSGAEGAEAEAADEGPASPEGLEHELIRAD